MGTPRGTAENSIYEIKCGRLEKECQRLRKIIEDLVDAKGVSNPLNDEGR